MSHQVIEPIADLRREPAHEAALDTQALFGERMTILETTDEGWVRGQLETDGYAGWLSANALGPASVAVYALALCVQLSVAVISFYSLVAAAQG